MDLNEIGRLLEQEIPADRFACTEGSDRRIAVVLEAADLKGAARALRRSGSARFVTLTALDGGEDIELLYVLAVGGTIVSLRARIPKETNATESVTDIFPGAELIEREVSELFGLTFAGHPRQKNLILPEDWSPDKAPLRKPLTGDVLPQARRTVENLLRDASSLRITPPALARREKAGLPQRPPLASGSEERMREFLDLVLRTGFDKRAGYDWGKKRLRYR